MKRDKEAYNAYMKKYMLDRYNNRRNEMFILLGGKCAMCKIIPEKYEFDHVDPKNKSFVITKLWSINKERFLEEISKCQILCEKCHSEKTLKDRGFNNAREVHGTISSYRYCKCSLCKAAKAFYAKYHTHAPLAQLVEQQTFDGSLVEESTLNHSVNSVNAEMPTPSQAEQSEGVETRHGTSRTDEGIVQTSN